jgi:uncharacterized protein YecE (DUF72 family)
MSLQIGTSGWTYPHWQKNFFPNTLPSDERLRFYANTFSTVELNTTFYGLPAVPTVRRWRDTVPPSFLFAIKGSRFTTHMKKLLDPKKSTVKFFRAIAPLKGQTTAVLFQLPPFFKINAQRLATFLKAMPPGYRYAFEFRNATWFHPEVYSILRSAKAALCLFDIKGMQPPEEITSDFVYLRLHGPQSQAYRGSYSRRSLVDWASKISQWQKSNKDVFVYFDNDEKGYAPINALSLRRLLE